MKITATQFLPILWDASVALHLKEKRTMVALAGPPGSGKTTLALKIQNFLNQKEAHVCAVLPMDGYHYDDGYLEAKGWRHRKGAPHTFDVGGLKIMLQRLSENTEEEIAIPLFDRTLEISRAGAQVVPQTARIVLVEGNYLLLNALPWASLRPYFDVTALLDVPPETIRQRLIARWQGFGLPEEEVLAKVEQNDLPNMEAVLQNSQKPQYLIET